MRDSITEPVPARDPLSWIPRIANKLHSLWLTWTYPFASVGRHLSAHYSCELARSAANLMSIGNSVIIGRDAWINVPAPVNAKGPVVLLDDDCKIGRRCVISARNKIHIGKNVLFGPSVLVTDHNHTAEDTMIPINEQGTTGGGSIRIEEGCWIGFGAVIVCSRGELVIGRNSVVGANSVVTKNVPPYSVVTGNPARVIKQFDSTKGQWMKGPVEAVGRS
jgi:acetyltransferase-like isoleucine patch superfamily enzyme